MSESPPEETYETKAAKGPPWGKFEQRHFDRLFKRLSEWRDEDHEDLTWLARFEIALLLDGFKALAASQPMTEEPDPDAWMREDSSAATINPATAHQWKAWGQGCIPLYRHPATERRSPAECESVSVDDLADSICRAKHKEPLTNFGPMTQASYREMACYLLDRYNVSPK